MMGTTVVLAAVLLLSATSTPIAAQQVDRLAATVAYAGDIQRFLPP